MNNIQKTIERANFRALRLALEIALDFMDDLPQDLNSAETMPTLEALEYLTGFISKLTVAAAKDGYRSDPDLVARLEKL